VTYNTTILLIINVFLVLLFLHRLVAMVWTDKTCKLTPVGDVEEEARVLLPII